MCAYWIIGTVLLALALGFIEHNPGTSVAIFAAVVVVGMVCFSVKARQDQEEAEQRNQRAARGSQAYERARALAVVPEKAATLNYRKGDLRPIQYGELHAWIEAGALCFFPASAPLSDSVGRVEGLVLACIPVERIDYFVPKGEVMQETRITGGGGGGSSMTGAVVGAAIAGGAGAIIGSRKAADPIRSETVTHDSRETVLFYLTEARERCMMVFDPEDYDRLDQLIPEKAHSVVSAVRVNRLLEKPAAGQRLADEIRDLAKLRDEGLLTEEEFAAKKKSILR